MKKTRRVVLDISTRYFRNHYLNYLVKVIINIALVLALLLNMNSVRYESIIDIFVFIGIFTIFEEVVAHYAYRFYAKYIVMSFSTVLIVNTAIAMSASYYVLADEIMFITTDIFYGFVVVFITLRKIVSILIINHLNRKRFAAIINKEVKRDV